MDSLPGFFTIDAMEAEAAFYEPPHGDPVPTDILMINGRRAILAEDISVYRFTFPEEAVFSTISRRLPRWVLIEGGRAFDLWEYPDFRETDEILHGVVGQEKWKYPEQFRYRFYEKHGKNQNAHPVLGAPVRGSSVT